MLFLGKFAQYSCQCKLKFGTWTNPNLQNSMVVLNFFRFRLEVPFLRKSDRKYQTRQFNLKFGIYTNSNMENSMVMCIFTFFALQVLSKKSIWHFDATSLTSQKFTRRDLLLFWKHKKYPKYYEIFLLENEKNHPIQYLQRNFTSVSFPFMFLHKRPLRIGL